MKSQTTLYFPIGDRSIWSGRVDALPNEYLYQTIKFLDLNTTSDISEPLTGFALLGFESDAGVIRNFGNPGAEQGPMAFRRAAAKLPIHTAFNLYDVGNVKCLDGDLEAAQAELKKRVLTLLSLGLIPIVIGGGHETAWGHFQGIAKHYHQEQVAILNFDAHFDLRPMTHGNHGSSGTPFRQINDYLKANNKPFNYYCAGIQPFSNTASLFEYAHANQVNYLLADKIHASPYDLSFIEKVIDSHQSIYVTLCLDVFSASIAPGVSAPQALGITSTYVIEALRRLKKSKKVIALDIVELAPKYDIRDQTAKLAAALFMEYIA